MQGFKPGASRPKAGRNYANGGVVDGIRHFLGFGNPQAKQPTPQAQAQPASPPPQQAQQSSASSSAPNRITDYAGGGALKRREQELGLKNGGVVHGPGTGTSDSIHKNVRGGSYIMPADSTAQIGPENLQALGFHPDAAPQAQAETPPKAQGFSLNLSNGEFEMTPEQVHAVGVQALDRMKNATHTPVPDENAADPKNFAKGGAVDDDPLAGVQPIPAATPNTQTAPIPAATSGAVDMAPVAAPKPVPDASAAAPSATQTATPTSPSSGDVSATPTPNKSWTTLSPDDPGNVGMNQIRAAQAAQKVTPDIARMIKGGAADVGDKLSAGQYPEAAGALASTVAAGVVAAPMHAALDAAKAVATPAWGFTKGLFHVDDSKPAAPAAAPATPATTTTTTPPTQVPAPPVQTPAKDEKKADTTQTADKKPADTTTPNNDIKRDGNSYSGTNVHGDNITINGKAPGGGTVSPQNMAAADALDARYAAMRNGALANAGGQAGLGGGSGGVISAPNQDRSRIMNAALTPLAGSPGQLTANQLRVAQGIYTGDQSNATSRYQTDTTARTASERNAADLQRQAMTEGGQDSRSAATNRISQADLAIRQKAAGFQTQNAQRMQNLYDKFAAPDTTEAEKAAIKEQIAVLNGQIPAQKYGVVPGGQEIDPVTNQIVSRPGRIYNTQTGQPVADQASATAGTQGGVPEPKTAAEYAALPKGAKYLKNGVTMIKE